MLPEPEKQLGLQQVVLENLKLQGAGEDIMVVERRKLWRLRMRVGNCRRRQRLQGLANKKQAGRRMPASLYDPNGLEVEDQTVWPDLVFNHFQHKFDRPGWNRERQR